MPRARPLVMIECLAYVALTRVGIAGFWLVPHLRVKWILAGYVVFSWALYVLANANHRFRVPLLPIFAIYTGPLLAACTASREDRRWRCVGAGVCLAAFLVVVAADLAKPRRRLRDTEMQEEALNGQWRREPTLYSGRA
jgi:hypothetical protein